MGKRLLITGAAGRLGQELSKRLGQSHPLTLLDLMPPLGAGARDRVITGDLADPVVRAAALQEVDAIIHLACRHGEHAHFEDMLETNYRASLALFEEGIAQGVTEIVFASSNHGWGFYDRAHTPLSVHAQPRPDSWYGISKLWTEAVLSYLSDRHGIRATSLRIGRCEASVPDERCRHMWISFDDLAQLIALSLQRTDMGHYVCFATSDSQNPFFDNQEAKALGFQPRDLPDQNWAHPDVGSQQPDPGFAGHFIGGVYAAENFKQKSSS